MYAIFKCNRLHWLSRSLETVKMKDSSPTTIRDVARHANVSIATVSRVLNDYPGVSDKTREAVRGTIEALGYTPNPIARQLSIGRTLTIGVILPYFHLPSYIERLRGVQEVLASSEYDLVIFTIDNPEQRNAYFQDLSNKSRVDGMLIVSLPPNNLQADNLSNSRIPTVLIDSEHAELCCIVADDLAGGRAATRHLIELGHTRIGFLTDFMDTPYHPAMRLRYSGYREELKKAGIRFEPHYLADGARGRTNARIMAHNLLAQPDPPTAIFAASDTQALGILDAADSLEIKVPEELSVIGYDNIRDSIYSNLTTIDQKLYDSGVIGAQMLLELLGNRIDPPCKRFVEINLVERGTTAPPSAAH